MALVWSSLTLEVMVLFFGAYALVAGVFALGAGLTTTEADASVR
jgi:uncharacterized membrane protein HdeD (DUF308 family)